MKMNLRSLSVLLIGVSVVIGSCNESADVPDQYEQFLQEVAAIDNYLVAEGLSAIENPSGVRMVVTKLGNKPPAQLNSTVDIDYVGRLFSTGTTFDQGNTKLKVSEYIGGWRDALTTLPEGSEAILLIPSALGYGAQGQSSIPPNSTLRFDIKFKDVIESTQEKQLLGSDTVAIDTYLDSKSIDAIKDTTGVRYIITSPGAGAQPSWYDKVKFKATYRLLTNDANVAAQVDYEPTEDYYNRVIDQIARGLIIGLQKIQVGSKATFYIPSGLGFGPQGASVQSQQVIPPNANIIVEVDFTEIVTP